MSSMPDEPMFVPHVAVIILLALAGAFRRYARYDAPAVAPYTFEGELGVTV